MADVPKIEPRAHSPERAGQRLGISTHAVYTHSKRRLIPDAELQRFVARKMAEAAA
jgi:hypothetical protein